MSIEDLKTLARFRLQEAAKLYEENPNTWIQGFSARNAQKRVVSPLAPESCEWCLSGVVAKVCGMNFDIRWAAFRLLNDKIEYGMPESLMVSNIVDWNDKRARTVNEVIAILKEAAQ